MTTAKPNQAPVFFKDAAAFRVWLEKNSLRHSELLVGFWKVGSGKASITWPESVDEALCFGWIDGVRKRIDERSYQIRFTPRRADSIWSAINIAKVAALTGQGRMRQAGLEAFARRIARKSSVYSYEQAGIHNLSADELREFRKDKGAWEYFEATPPSYRKIILYWVTSAKRSATRTRRFSELVAACAIGQRLFK